jgi:hypothetical protein
VVSAAGGDTQPRRFHDHVVVLNASPKSIKPPAFRVLTTTSVLRKTPLANSNLISKLAGYVSYGIRRKAALFSSARMPIPWGRHILLTSTSKFLTHYS